MKLSLGKNIVIFIILTKIITNDAITCEDVLELPDEKKISLRVLKTIPPKDIIECLAHLGKEPLPMEQADYIWQTIVKFFDGIKNIPDSVLTILHYVTVAIKPEEYANLTLSNIDVVGNFGLDYNLSQDQLQAIAEKVREDFAGKEPDDYTYYDLMALKQILCQFNSSEIERIHPLAYREAAIMVGKLKKCRKEVMSAFAILAMQPAAFGPPHQWTNGIVKTIGRVAEFLPKDIIDRYNVDSENKYVENSTTYQYQ